MTKLGNIGPTRKKFFVRLGKCRSFTYLYLYPSSMTTRTGNLFYAAMAALIVMASACNGGTTSPLASVAGNYVLQAANGQLPLRFFRTNASGQTTIDITAGTLSMGTNRTFEEVLQFHVAPPSANAYDAPVVTDGTFTVEGSTITFTFQPPGGQAYVWTGTIGTSSITYTDLTYPDITGGLTAVYTK